MPSNSRREFRGLKQVSICVVNDIGSVVREGVVDFDPEAIAAFVRSRAPKAVRVGLKTGPTVLGYGPGLNDSDYP